MSFSPRHSHATWRYSFQRRCNAPVPTGRCGHLLIGAQRIPVEVDGRMPPGPVISHRPYGHSCVVGRGWLVGRGWDHSAIGHSGQ